MAKKRQSFELVESTTAKQARVSTDKDMIVELDDSSALEEHHLLLNNALLRVISAAKERQKEHEIRRQKADDLIRSVRAAIHNICNKQRNSPATMTSISPFSDSIRRIPVFPHGGSLSFPEAAVDSPPSHSLTLISVWHKVLIRPDIDCVKVKLLLGVKNTST